MDVLPGSSHDDASEIGEFASISSSDPLSFYATLEPDIQWTRDKTRILIEVVSDHFEEFYDKTVKKKVLWKRIAAQMRNNGVLCSPDECDKKWRNLKKSYTAVLKKQTQCDFTSKFVHFDQMHLFLGKEIDPYGLREQARCRVAANKGENHFENAEMDIGTYLEIGKDGKFDWSKPIVNIFMDTILEEKMLFETSMNIDDAWEVVSKRMKSNGLNVSQIQCQRKWINLLNGFQHFMAEATSTGETPQWPYYNGVRTILNSMNVPVTLTNDCGQNGLPFKRAIGTPQKAKILKNNKRRKLTENKSDSEEEPTLKDSNSTLMTSLKRLEKNLKVDKRLKHLEDRVQEAQKQKAASKVSIDLLQAILAELRQINSSLEEKTKNGGLSKHKDKDEEFDSISYDEETPIVDEDDYQQYQEKYKYLNIGDISSTFPNYLKCPKEEHEELEVLVE